MWFIFYEPLEEAWEQAVLSLNTEKLKMTQEGFCLGFRTGAQQGQEVERVWLNFGFRIMVTP